MDLDGIGIGNGVVGDDLLAAKTETDQLSDLGSPIPSLPQGDPPVHSASLIAGILQVEWCRVFSISKKMPIISGISIKIPKEKKETLLLPKKDSQYSRIGVPFLFSEGC